jgi:hypothetical protein
MSGPRIPDCFAALTGNATLLSLYGTETEDRLSRPLPPSAETPGASVAYSSQPHVATDDNWTTGFCRLPKSHGMMMIMMIISPWLSTLTYHLGMNSRPVGGRSSETRSDPSDMNMTHGKNDNVTWKQCGRKWSKPTSKNYPELGVVPVTARGLDSDLSSTQPPIWWVPGSFSVGYSYFEDGRSTMLFILRRCFSN